jgi:hypothetical protein
MSDTSEKHMLRFGCPECGTRLVVDPSLAGKEGPCPSCGGVIIAPPIAAATSLVAKAGAPVEIKPRAIGRKAGVSPSSAQISPTQSSSNESEVSSAPATTVDRRRGRRRSGVVSTGASNVSGVAAASGADTKAAIPTTNQTANHAASMGGRKISADTSISQKATASKDLKTLMLMVLITCIVVCIALGVYYYMTIGE